MDVHNQWQIDPLDPSSLGLGGRDYYVHYNESHRRIEAYKNYMTTIARLLNVTESNTERFVRSTIALERRLVQVEELTAFLMILFTGSIVPNSIDTLCRKNDTDVAHYNFDADKPILIIFGR